MGVLYVQDSVLELQIYILFVFCLFHLFLFDFVLMFCCLLLLFVIGCFFVVSFVVLVLFLFCFGLVFGWLLTNSPHLKNK